MRSLCCNIGKLNHHLNTAGWQHRQQLLSYCYEVVGEKVMRDQAVVKGQDPRLSAKSSPVDTFEEEVLVSGKTRGSPFRSSIHLC